uniref:(northern house mosquito) hypothetical protein n=1 Tax=Culex pipiens TaxID=7175 RepID=A0A8D8E3U2_CULPI
MSRSRKQSTTSTTRDSRKWREIKRWSTLIRLNRREGLRTLEVTSHGHASGTPRSRSSNCGFVATFGTYSRSSGSETGHIIKRRALAKAKDCGSRSNTPRRRS